MTRKSWLARDRMGHVGIFLGDSNVLETEARLLAALCATDGTSWLAAKDDDAESERVVVVITESENERGYRAARAGVEDQVSGAGWVVQRVADPRVLVSTRTLSRAERDAIRSCDEPAIVLGERAVRSLVRDRTDAVHRYVADAYGWNQSGAKPTAPLHARSLDGYVAKLPVEFASSPTIAVGEHFDGSRDGAWTQAPYKLSVRALLVTAVHMSVLVAFVALGLYSLTSSLWIAIAFALLAIVAATAFVNRGVKQTLIDARDPEHPVRVAPGGPRVRVADENEEEETAGEEKHAARR